MHFVGILMLLFLELSQGIHVPVGKNLMTQLCIVLQQIRKDRRWSTLLGLFKNLIRYIE